MEAVESQNSQPGETSCTVELTNFGTQSFDLYINGEFYRTEKVTFTND